MAAGFLAGIAKQFSAVSEAIRLHQPEVEVCRLLEEAPFRTPKMKYRALESQFNSGVGEPHHWISAPALIFALLLGFVVLRSLFLGTLENPEPRYTLECYPVVLAFAGVAFV